MSAGTAADGATIKEGSFFVGKGGRLSQIVNGRPVVVAIRQGKSGEGITTRAAKVIRALLPIRDAIRDVLRAQAADRPWAEAQVRLRVAYSAFIRYFGPINHTVITTVTDPETGEERETHRRPNLSHFADDPDCWLVASIESYDVETGLARKGPIFSERVIAPPVAPLITSATDALAVTLNETGRVDLDYLADLLERDLDAALAELGDGRLPQPGDDAVGDRRRLPLRPGADQARGCRSRRRARSAIRAERHRAARRPAEGHQPVRYHRAARRALDPDRRHRGLCARCDGRRGPHLAHRRIGDLDRRGLGLRGHGCRHVRVGHLAPACRSPAARCPQQRDTADLRHRC